MVLIDEAAIAQSEKMMGDRKSGKLLFIAGTVELLIGILMIAVQLSGRVMYGEKLHLGIAVVFLILSPAFVGISRQLNVAGQVSD